MHDDSFINMPLVFLKLESSRATGSHMPTPKDFLNFFCGMNMEFDRHSIIQRYDDLIPYDRSVLAFPRHERFGRTFSDPLKYAKVNYLLGNFRGSIALSGFIGEMCAVFQYDLSLWLKNEKKSNIHNYLNKFSRISQQKRINFLKDNNAINEPFGDTLLQLNELRNRYVHGYRIDEEESRSNAQIAYGCAVRITLATIGQEVRRSLLEAITHNKPLEVQYIHPVVSEFLRTAWK